MTSNIGSRQLKDFGQGVGFTPSSRQQQSDEYARSVIENALKKTFAPEFLNRIDDVVIFDSLKREDIYKIIDLELTHLYKRVEALGYTVELTTAAKDYLIDKGWDEQFGARPLKRAIQKYVEDALAEEIIATKLQSGDKITVVFEKDENKIDVQIEHQVESTEIQKNQEN